MNPEAPAAGQPADPAALGTTADAGLVALGGPVVAVLLLMSVFALAIVLLKAWQFWRLRLWQREFIGQAAELFRAGREREALALLGRYRHPAALVLDAAIRGVTRMGATSTLLREEVQRVAARELTRLRVLLRPLEVIAALSPLLGLFGTVLGMIEAFQALEGAGSRVNPAVLSGGIWEALLTTAVGLGVAIPAMAAFHALDRLVDGVAGDMEDSVTRVFTAGVSGDQPSIDLAAVRESRTGTAE